MKHQIESPFTDGIATLHQEQKIHEFRGEQFQITQLYYKCNVTGEEFTNDELDQLNVDQIYEQYRERYGNII